MFKFLFKTAFFTVVGVLLLHGAHTLYVRYRDRKFDIETETQIARHFAEKSSKWVKDMLKEQRLKLAERPNDRPASIPKTNDVVITEPVGPVPAPEVAEPIRDPAAHNRRNRRIFRNTVQSLSKTESILKAEEKK